jgi:two-component system, sensor histidine kinase and response regulator
MQPSCRILLAEDNPTNQKVALLQLKKIGFTADTAVNGCEALKMCQSNEYDIILMDCQMPEMDGYETTRVLRRWASSTPPLIERVPKIIALTANALRGDKDKCLAAGMDDYIAKPVTLDGLREVILRHLPPTPTVIETAPMAPPRNSTPPAPLAPPPAASLVDSTRFNSVTHHSDGSLDSEAFAIFQAAMMELPGRLDTLRQKSGLDLMREAHQLKGMVAVFGFARLAELLGELQGVAGYADQPEINRRLAELREVCADSLVELSTLCPALAA